MIPFPIKPEIKQSPITITYSSSLSKTPLTNHISTSPHSLHSPDTNKGRLLNLTPSHRPNLSCPGSLKEQIKISLYNRFCVLDCEEGQKCIDQLEKALHEWGTSQQTKISVKLLVSHKLAHNNAKLKYIFDATVREYEQLYRLKE